MEYLAFTGDSLADLVQKVNKAIADGWQPLGGISRSDKWAQAMTKERATQQPTKKGK